MIVQKTDTLQAIFWTLELDNKDEKQNNNNRGRSLEAIDAPLNYLVEWITISNNCDVGEKSNLRKKEHTNHKSDDSHIPLLLHIFNLVSLPHHSHETHATVRIEEQLDDIDSKYYVAGYSDFIID